MTEWIRPTRCEGGACVEYRTVANTVFVRSTTDPDHMIAPSVAEWDTFVAGLKDERLLDAEARAESFAAGVTRTAGERDRWAAKAHQLAADRVDLAAEIARLRQEIGDNHRLRFEVEKVLDGILGTEWTDGAGAGLVADVQLVGQRLTAAIAEAAVLRHRDRRTKAVVDAARSLTTHGPAGVLAMANPGWAQDWVIERDRRWANLRTALDSLEAPAGPPEPVSVT